MIRACEEVGNICHRPIAQSISDFAENTADDHAVSQRQDSAIHEEQVHHQPAAHGNGDESVTMPVPRNPLTGSVIPMKAAVPQAHNIV